jgi:hypothetical protein
VRKPLLYESPDPANRRRADSRGPFALLALGAADCAYAAVTVAKCWPLSSPPGRSGLPFLVEWFGIVSVVVGPLCALVAAAALWWPHVEPILDATFGAPPRRRRPRRL